MIEGRKDGEEGGDGKKGWVSSLFLLPAALKLLLNATRLGDFVNCCRYFLVVVRRLATTKRKKTKQNKKTKENKTDSLLNIILRERERERKREREYGSTVLLCYFINFF